MRVCTHVTVLILGFGLILINNVQTYPIVVAREATPCGKVPSIESIVFQKLAALSAKSVDTGFGVDQKLAEIVVKG